MKNWANLLAGERTGHGFQGGHVMAQPINVGGFGGDGFVLTADYVPEPFDGEGQVHHQADFGREGWTKAVQGAISISYPVFQ